jgi:CheY-like chemotaxis protein
MNESEARILLADDAASLRDQIISAFADNGWRIDGFGDVKSATDAIANARREGWEYDAAILDFRLPTVPLDRNTPVDKSLCQMVRHRTLVWHISAHFGEEEVELHVRTYHSADEQVARIKKTEGFIRELERQIKQALAARRIKESMAMLQSGSNDSGYSRRMRPDSAAVSATNLHGRLCGDIKRFWHELTPAFQDELRESFEIQLDKNDQVETVYPR